MTLCDRLLKQLELRGLSVAPGDRPDQLRLLGPKAEATPDVMAALAAFKPELLVRFKRVDVAVADPEPPPPKESPAVASGMVQFAAKTERCRVCGRRVDAEDREALRGVNPLCTQGGSKAVTDGNGAYHPASERCPYKVPL